LPLTLQAGESVRPPATKRLTVSSAVNIASIFDEDDILPSSGASEDGSVAMFDSVVSILKKADKLSCSVCVVM
jgi:hypothetical protein